MGPITAAAEKIKRHRLVTQAFFLVALNSYFLQLHSVCVPAFNCNSCPLSVFACPIGVLVNFSALRIFPFVAVGIIGLAGVIGGRLICGWGCPFGFLQDLLHKIPTRKLHLPPQLSYTKYFVLIGLVFMVPFFWPNGAFNFCNFCPAGTLESTIPWAFMGVSSSLSRLAMRVAILVAILILAVLVSRSFCRVFCPLGAMFGLCNKFSLFRMRLTGPNCTDCGRCEKDCSVEMHPVHELNGSQCIRSLDCTPTGHLKLGIR